MAEEIWCDVDAFELYRNLYGATAKYADSRAYWFLWSKGKIEQDSTRTLRRSRVIDAFNMLARYLKRHGKSASWCETLRDENENSGYRKRIRDFACYFVFVESLNAR